MSAMVHSYPTAAGSAPLGTGVWTCEPREAAGARDHFAAPLPVSDESAYIMQKDAEDHPMLTPTVTPHTYMPRIPEILGFSSKFRVYTKEESYQHGGSVKGRVAYAMACQSKRSGRRIVESSSGNLALGLAFWCERLGAPRPLCLLDDCCEISMREALTNVGCIIESVRLTDREIEEQAGVHKRIALAEEYSRQGNYWPNQYDGDEWVRV